jgi:hypothetical protein
MSVVGVQDETGWGIGRLNKPPSVAAARQVLHRWPRAVWSAAATRNNDGALVKITIRTKK